VAFIRAVEGVFFKSERFFCPFINTLSATTLFGRRTLQQIHGLTTDSVFINSGLISDFLDLHLNLLIIYKRYFIVFHIRAEQFPSTPTNQ
jgi:hypothetical protein